MGQLSDDMASVVGSGDGLGAIKASDSFPIGLQFFDEKYKNDTGVKQPLAASLMAISRLGL